MRLQDFSIGIGIVVLFLAISLMAGCGLPNIVFISSPIVQSDGGKNILRFKTPAVESRINIIGYSLYYKIYTDKVSDLASEDKLHLTETSSIYSNAELKPGNEVLKNRGFVTATSGADESESNFPNNQVVLPFPSSSTPEETEIIIDFTPIPKYETAIAQIKGKEPIFFIRRGFFDISRKTTILKFPGFFRDWAYVPNGGKTGYYDGDLYRPPGEQPGTPGKDFTGERLIISENQDLFIAFATYTVALNVSDGPPKLNYSKPVYLGYVTLDGTPTTSRY